MTFTAQALFSRSFLAFKPLQQFSILVANSTKPVSSADVEMWLSFCNTSILNTAQMDEHSPASFCLRKFPFSL